MAEIKGVNKGVKMVSMKRAEKDKRKDMGEPCSIDAMAPDYPWGLCIHLDGDELDKLGIKDLPAIGTEMPITVKVRVTRLSQSAAEDKSGEANEQRSMDLQITDIGLG